MRASPHDITVFCRAGLQAMIPNGHRIIDDAGYAGEPLVISTPNAHDANCMIWHWNILVLNHQEVAR